MSAKLIYSLTENENPDLHKQIGCMHGFFHLFDRHRRVAGHGHRQKRLPPPPGFGSTESQEVQEKRRSSIESSRPSFSTSSCSSSFSSLEYNKAVNAEPSPTTTSQTSCSETPSRDFLRKPSDLRDAVKNSMYRDARGLSVKTTAVRRLRHIDSPRPLEPPDSSLRVLPKFRESGYSKSFDEKDGRSVGLPRDLRRLSYDGRESHENLKAAIKLKELPRLSLDSRQGCIRSNSANLPQEPGSSKRASSVVAKLMGLVDPMPVGDDVKRPEIAGKDDPLSKSLKGVKGNKQDHLSRSPRNSQKELNPARPKNADPAMKTNSNHQKFPIEMAPWRQQPASRNRGPLAPGFRSQEASAKTATTPLTVYGEIEKRLADLEFKKSGKDLRALKQILAAMQKTKDTTDDMKDEKLASQVTGLDYSSNLGNTRNVRNDIPSVSTKSPIVIMKPAKLVRRSTGTASNLRADLRKQESAETGKAPMAKQMTKFTERNNQDRSPKTRNTKLSNMTDSEENSGSSGRISGSTSPRLQQRRLVSEKQSTPASSSDSSSQRRHSSGTQPKCSSPGRKYKPGSSHTQRTSEGETYSLQSESNISLVSEDIDGEVTSIIRLDQIGSVNFEQKNRYQKSPSSGFGVNKTVPGPARAVSEQPSPISVLDDAFYRDDSPSPVKKKTSSAFKDDEIPYPDESEWELIDLDQLPNGRNDVDQNAQETFISSAESFFCDSTNPDHIYISDILKASDLPRKLGHSWPNIRLSSSPHLIHPKLFHVLEQPDTTPQILHERIHRKLVFDVVNEILVRRVLVTDSFTQWLSPEKLAMKPPRGHRLFTELCSEVDRLRGNNSGNGEDDEDSLQSIISDSMPNWAEFGREIPAVVLDVERLIFKDLITEFVNGCGVSGGRLRKLFLN